MLLFTHLRDSEAQEDHVLSNYVLWPPNKNLTNHLRQYKSLLQDWGPKIVDTVLFPNKHLQI